MPPRVSLILPVRNGENFLAATLACLCNQTFTDFELIICDNASIDRTGDIARAFARRDARIVYRYNARNLGAAENYNRGFAQARADYVKWCAHDDLLSANFLELCVAALDGNAKAVLAHGATLQIDAAGHVRAARQNFADIPGYSPARRFAMMTGPCDTLIFGLWRASALRRTRLHRAYYGSDRAVLAEMALLGDFVAVPQARFYNREHPARSVHIADKRLRALWQSTDGGNRLGLEHWAHLSALVAIAWRRRRDCPLPATLYHLIRAALQPHQLCRHAIELVGLVSPGLQRRMRERAWAMLQSMQRFRLPRSDIVPVGERNAAAAVERKKDRCA